MTSADGPTDVFRFLQKGLRTEQFDADVVADDSAKPFRLRVVGTFVLTGRGTVVYGDIEQGTLTIGDLLQIGTGGPRTRCVGIDFMDRRLGDEPKAWVGLWLADVEMLEIGEGSMICAV